MSRLFQIMLSNGSIYVTREPDEEEFHKSKVYKLRRGCIVSNKVSLVQMFDISDNTYYTTPITILSNHIVEVKPIKKDSEYEALYLKVTSGIITVKNTNKLSKLN